MDDKKILPTIMILMIIESTCGLLIIGKHHKFAR